MGTDLQQGFQLLLFLQRVGLNSKTIQFALKKLSLNNKSTQLVGFTLRKIRDYQNIDRILKVKGHLNVTIEPGEKINQYTIPNTAKCIFCPACWIYDCKNHKNPIEQNFYRFTHRRNKTLPFPDASPLVKARDSIQKGDRPAG